MPVDPTPLKRLVEARVSTLTSEPVVEMVDTFSPHWATCKAPKKFARGSRAPEGAGSDG